MEQLGYTIDGFRKATGNAFGVTRIYELINEGKLETVKVGRRRIITARSAKALLGLDEAA